MGIAHYYLAAGNTDTALLSKYAMFDKASLQGDRGRTFIHAGIRTPDGQTLHVYVAHFHLGNLAMCELQKLSLMMAPDLIQRTVIMGDMNLRGSIVKVFLGPMGLRNLSGSFIDQIWMNQTPAEELQAVSLRSLENTAASDHSAVAAEISIYPRLGSNESGTSSFVPPGIVPTFAVNLCH